MYSVLQALDLGLSKAFERSMNNAETQYPLSVTIFYFSYIIIKECCVP